MTNRGKPLPFTIRQAIKEARASGITVRQVAAAVGVSKTTAQKYGGKFGTR